MEFLLAIARQVGVLFNMMTPKSVSKYSGTSLIQLQDQTDGQISEIARNRHVYILSCHVIHCQCKQLYLSLFRFRTVEILASSRPFKQLCSLRTVGVK